MGSIKTFKKKLRYAKAQNKNRLLPNWYRFKSDTNIRWNSKRRHWRRKKLNF